MKKYKIDGEVYELQENVGEAPDAYSKKGKLLDDAPKGKFIGFVIMDDGSVIECYKSFNWLIAIIPLLLIILGVAGFLVYVFFFQDKDYTIPGSEVVIKEGEDQNIITYNGFTSISPDNGLDLNFQNGSEECKITITGEGIEDVEYMAAPYSFTEFIPIKYTTDEGLVVATMTLTTATSTVTNEIAIEIPENYTPDSVTESLDGYWEGEYIYGVPATQ